MVLGISFIILQYVECRECCLNLVDSSYASASLCLVGLHFVHVLAGVSALLYIYNWFDRFVSSYYPGLIV